MQGCLTIDFSKPQHWSWDSLGSYVPVYAQSRLLLPTPRGLLHLAFFITLIRRNITLYEHRRKWWELRYWRVTPPWNLTCPRFSHPLKRKKTWDTSTFVPSDCVVGAFGGLNESINHHRCSAFPSACGGILATQRQPVSSACADCVPLGAFFAIRRGPLPARTL